MVQDTLNSLTNNIDTLLWPESYISVARVMGGEREVLLSTVDIISEIVILALIFSLFIFFYGRVLEGVLISFRAIFNSKKVVSIENSALLYGARNTMLVFSTIIISFVIVAYNKSLFSFLQDRPIWFCYLLILGSVSLYILYRYLIAKVFTFFLKKSLFLLLYRYSLTYFAIIILLIPTWLLLDGFAYESVDNLIYSGLCLVAFLIYLIQIIRGFKLIIEEEFSYLFYILYLCTLEILPMVLLFSLISN